MLESYIESHISAEPEHLARLRRDTWLQRLYPQMCSGHLQGRMLAMLTAMIRPHNVIELGTFSGYSALCLAEGLAPDGHVHTVEIDDEAQEFIQNHLDSSPYAGSVTLHIGDAVSVIPSLDPLKWDLAYIDANKRHYCQYLDLLLPRMAIGGYIIADNTLWHGKVADLDHNDAQTQGLRRFNDRIAADPRLNKVILPLRDGLTLIRLNN